MLRLALPGRGRETIRVMAEPQPLQGELQAQLMNVIWALGSGTVEEVRAELPPEYRGAYNTVQTVLNRLSDRGLLTRAKRGRGYAYASTITEAEYLAQTIQGTLAGASTDARQAALVNVIGRIDPAELDELQALARQAETQRRSPS